MGPEIFESSTFSIVLTWIFSIPIILGILGAVIGYFFEDSDQPIIFSIWIFLCLLVLSPIRYIILQVLMGSAFIFQSFSAFFNLLLLALYVPVIFSILYAIGVVAPVYLTYLFSGLNKKLSTARYWIAGILAPILFVVFSYFFYLALPYAGSTTGWVHPKNIIRSTNGPANIYFEYVVEDLTPLSYPNYVHEIGLNNMTSRERLRAHVASIYFSDSGHYYYLKETYPELIEDN